MDIYRERIMKIIVELDGYNLFLQDIMGYMTNLSDEGIIMAMAKDIDYISSIIYDILMGNDPNFEQSHLLSHLCDCAHESNIKLSSKDVLHLAKCSFNLIMPQLSAIYRIIDFYNYEFRFISYETGHYDDASVSVTLGAVEILNPLDPLDDQSARKLWTFADKSLRAMCGDI